MTITFWLKKPWLYSRWGFRDTFQKSGFHVIWCGNILKLPMGDIFEVAELFSPDLELFFWKLARCNEIRIFLPFGLNMLLGWLKNNRKCYGALKTGVWRCTIWKKKFWHVLICFWPVYLQFDAFFAFSKKSGTDCPKKFFWAKIWIVTCKTWYKSQKIHPLWLKNPAEIQEMSFGQGKTFFHWSRAVFLKISQMQWNLDFFAILAKYVAGVAKR